MNKQKTVIDKLTRVNLENKWILIILTQWPDRCECCLLVHNPLHPWSTILCWFLPCWLLENSKLLWKNYFWVSMYIIIVHENSSLKFDYDKHKYKISKRVSDTNSQKEPYSYTFYHSGWTFHYSGYWIMIKNIPVIQVYSFTLLYFSRPSKWPTNSPITS